VNNDFFSSSHLLEQLRYLVGLYLGTIEGDVILDLLSFSCDALHQQPLQAVLGPQELHRINPSEYGDFGSCPYLLVP